MPEIESGKMIDELKKKTELIVVCWKVLCFVADDSGTACQPACQSEMQGTGPYATGPIG